MDTSNRYRSLGDLLGLGRAERAALDALANVQERRGRHAELVETLETVLALDALDASTWERLERAYRLVGKERRARVAGTVCRSLVRSLGFARVASTRRVAIARQRAGADTR